MPERGRAAAPTRRARTLRRHIPIFIAGALAVAVAATATLAGIRIFRGDDPELIGGRPSAPARGAPTSPAASGGAEPGAASPTEKSRAAARRAELVVIPLPVPPGGRPAPYDEIARLLDVSPHSALAAYVDEFRGAGPLHVRDADGTVTDHDIGPSGTSPVAAAIAPDETWLAAVDGSGVLWRVELDGGEPSVISTGSDTLVYGLALEFMPDGRLLTTQVGSTTVPLPSRVVIVDPGSRQIEVLSDEEMAYQPTPLADGAVAYLTTEADGSTAVRRTEGGRQTLGIGMGQTTSAAVSADGRHVAVERTGGKIELISLPGGASRALGDGARPVFSPAGDTLAVLDIAAGRAVVLDLDGNEISRRPSLHVAWIKCPEGCAP